MRGVNLLKETDTPFGILSVVTDFSLDYAKEIFNFFYENDLTDVSFNSEEKEGANQSSSLESDDSEKRYKNFLEQFWQCVKTSDKKFYVREFAFILDAILYQSPDIGKSLTNQPMGILTFDSEGNFSSYSPELLTIKDTKYENFILGNVFENSFDEVLRSEKFERISRDIQAGFDLCEQECEYFFRCGGGTPVAKLEENGDFASKETMYCRLKYQIPTDIVLNDFEAVIAAR